MDADGTASIEPGIPLHIKVPDRNSENQPYIGFTTIELAKKFMEIKGFSGNDFKVVSVEEGSNAAFQKQAMLKFDTEAQITAMEKDIEGYDYESQIHASAS